MFSLSDHPYVQSVQDFFSHSLENTVVALYAVGAGVSAGIWGCRRCCRRNLRNGSDGVDAIHNKAVATMATSDGGISPKKLAAVVPFKASVRVKLRKTSDSAGERSEALPRPNAIPNATPNKAPNKAPSAFTPPRASSSAVAGSSARRGHVDKDDDRKETHRVPPPIPYINYSTAPTGSAMTTASGVQIDRQTCKPTIQFSATFAVEPPSSHGLASCLPIALPPARKQKPREAIDGKVASNASALQIDYKKLVFGDYETQVSSDFGFLCGRACPQAIKQYTHKPDCIGYGILNVYATCYSELGKEETGTYRTSKGNFERIYKEVINKSAFENAVEEVYTLFDPYPEQKLKSNTVFCFAMKYVVLQNKGLFGIWR
ncbi:MAG TPA: hypothetical protein VN457_03555 [Chlamydiales bacterium]|nr:hypothetical protein [Chlamydiales bacterium]